MTENDISRMVVDLCFRIHKQYGPGLFESVYEEYFAMNGQRMGYCLKDNMGVPLVHEEIRMGSGLT